MTDRRIAVRWAGLDDDAELLALDRAAFATPGSGFPSLTNPGPEVFFNERSRPQHVLVAECESRRVGYLRLKDKYPFTEGAGVLGVFGLGVAPDARRLGVASALLEQALAEARRRGARKIVLNVLGTNIAAQRLYQRHGFEVEGRSRAEFCIDGTLVDDLSLAKVV